MKKSELIKQLRETFCEEYKKDGDAAIAKCLGMSLGTLKSWTTSSEDLKAFQVANLLVKAQRAAVEQSNYETIRPIVEFYPISSPEQRSGYEILPPFKDAGKIEKGLREALSEKSGLYIFYDSRGRAIYAGKARKQSLLKEMNLAFIRDRGWLQTITLVKHPYREQTFEPAYDAPRQPVERAVPLCELAHYFSAYWVNDPMIDDLEALLVRGFANDLLNKKMETFKHFRR